MNSAPFYCPPPPALKEESKPCGWSPAGTSPKAHTPRNSTMQTSLSDSLFSAVQGYFNLMYDCNVERFYEVFHPTAQLHGVVKETLAVWPASMYRDILSRRISPESSQARRQDEILLVDVVGEDQALVKVRVRINDKVFIDHLSLLRVQDRWCITSKTFHLESEQDESGSGDGPGYAQKAAHPI
jgi:hypothetical protein